MSQGKIKELKKKIFLTALRAGAAHLASAFSVIDLLYVLYSRKYIEIDLNSPWKKNRDRLILSKGHACLAQYVMLNEMGAISDNELNNFCQKDSHLGGEPKYMAFPGIEASTGSLGHGLSFAVGIAMAYKADKIGNHIFVIIGDGECQEGSVWEAVMSISRFRLNNLILIIDDNQLQAMDSVKNIIGITDWTERFQAFGLKVKNINGHDLNEVHEALDDAIISEEPIVIISHTIKGHGVSFMENVPIWHYRMPNERELQIIKSELNITAEEIEYARCIS